MGSSKNFRGPWPPPAAPDASNAKRQVYLKSKLLVKKIKLKKVCTLNGILSRISHIKGMSGPSQSEIKFCLLIKLAGLRLYSCKGPAVSKSVRLFGKDRGPIPSHTDLTAHQDPVQCSLVSG